MVECNVGNNRNEWVGHVGSVPFSAESDFENGGIDILPREMPQAEKSHYFEFGWLP